MTNANMAFQINTTSPGYSRCIYAIQSSQGPSQGAVVLGGSSELGNTPTQDDKA